MKKDLHVFLRTLFAPWGFGKEYQATEKEVRARIRRLRLRVFNNSQVHFKDVLLALSEEVHRAEAQKKGATIDLPQYFQAKLASGWQKTSRINQDDYMINPVSKENIMLDHVQAVEFIQKAFRRFLEHKRTGSNVGKPNEGQSRSTAERMFAAEADRLGPGDRVASCKGRSSGGLSCSASATRLGIGEGAVARASNPWNIPRRDCADEARSSLLLQPMHKTGGDSGGASDQLRGDGKRPESASRRGSRGDAGDLEDDSHPHRHPPHPASRLSSTYSQQALERGAAARATGLIVGESGGQLAAVEGGAAAGATGLAVGEGGGQLAAVEGGAVIRDGDVDAGASITAGATVDSRFFQWSSSDVESRGAVSLRLGDREEEEIELCADRGRTRDLGAESGRSRASSRIDL